MCQAVHVFVAGEDHVTVTDVAASATVSVDPVTVHADDGEHATVIAGRCPDFSCGRLNATWPDWMTGADQPATGPFTFLLGTVEARGAGGGVAAGRLGFADGRGAGADGGGVDVGSGRAVALLEGEGVALVVGVVEGLGANGSSDGAAGPGSDAGGALVGWGIPVADIVGAASATNAGSGVDVKRTPTNPTTGIARAVPAAMRIKPGRCTIPPTRDGPARCRDVWQLCPRKGGGKHRPPSAGHDARLVREAQGALGATSVTSARTVSSSPLTVLPRQGDEEAPSPG